MHIQGVWHDSYGLYEGEEVAITGRTPVEYIREMRMSRAAELLSQGKFSVSEVMYTVGFSNSSYFSKCISKEYGMTPTDYMKVKR